VTWVLDNLGLITDLTVEHLRQSALPIVLGFLVSIPVGWAAFRYTAVRGPVLALVGLLYTIPSLGLFGLLAAALGISFLSETNLVVALTIYAVAIMTRSVADALDSVDRTVRDAATAMGYSPWRRFWTVELPLAGPVLLAGLRVTAVSTIALATVGILIGVENLGYLFTNGSQRRIVAEVLAGVVAVVLVAVVIDLLLVWVGRLVMPWLPRHSRRRAAARAARQAVAA